MKKLSVILTILLVLFSSTACDFGKEKAGATEEAIAKTTGEPRKAKSIELESRTAAAETTKAASLKIIGTWWGAESNITFRTDNTWTAEYYESELEDGTYTLSGNKLTTLTSYGYTISCTVSIKYGGDGAHMILKYDDGREEVLQGSGN